MAVAAFWDVFELRMKVFECLRDDRCDADLARCARVHYTWTDLALNALWLGYPRTQGNDSDSNVKRTEAIALLPRDRRQDYASRVSVLDFSKLGGTCRLVHAMFDGLNFPRLKEVILNNVENSMREGLRLSKYLQPTLESLKLVDRSYEDERNWLTASFLADAAGRCPGLKEVSFCIPYANFEPRDLTQFLRSIRPQMVSLDFGESTSEILTLDLLCALSHGGCLESLAFAPSEGEFTHIKVDHLQSFFDATRNPFPSLKRLDIALDSRAVPWIPQCFPMVTWLRMEIWSTRRDESTLRPIAHMSQLQSLEIVGDGDEHEHDFTIPARAFIPLGSLFQLRSLKIGTSFYPFCMREENSEEYGSFPPDDKFSIADASDMFSGLSALEHLSINAHQGIDNSSDHIWESISKFCPKLSSLHFVGKLDLWDFVTPNAPVIMNVTDITIEAIGVTDSVIEEMRVTGVALERVKTRRAISQAVRIIDNFAPKLQRLRCTGRCSLSKQICDTWAEFRDTQNFFQHKGRSRARELFL